MSTYLTTGFVLRVRPWREQARLYTLLTERQGKVEVVAAGGQKLSAKLTPHLQPFAEVELMVARGKQLDRLAGANLKQVYLKPPYHLNTAVLGTALLEITDVLTHTDAADPKLYQVLRQHLSDLAQLSTTDANWRPCARWLLTSFIVETLKLAGLAIPLTHCEQCRGELVEPVVFSWSSHGFYHRTCLPAGEQGVELSSGSLAWFQRAAGAGVTAGEALPPSALGFLTDYVSGQANRELYTLRVLRSIL